MIKGTNQVPRISVFRSNRFLNIQVIDDSANKTLLNMSDKDLKASKKTKIDVASEIGEMLAQQAKEKGISKVVFDRGGYKYHGRVKALAEGLRKGGLQF